MQREQYVQKLRGEREAFFFVFHFHGMKCPVVLETEQ